MPLNRTLEELAAIAGARAAKAVLDDPSRGVIVIVSIGNHRAYRAVWSGMNAGQVRAALRGIVAPDTKSEGVRECEAPS